MVFWFPLQLCFLFILQDPSEDCAPFQYANKKPIVPCGAIANSMFNDTFRLFQITGDGKKKEVPLDGKGIAWWTDYNIKYKNPSVTPLKNAFNGTVCFIYHCAGCV